VTAEATGRAPAGEAGFRLLAERRRLLGRVYEAKEGQDRRLAEGLRR
jgi:hypothetical protein